MELLILIAWAIGMAFLLLAIIGSDKNDAGCGCLIILAFIIWSIAGCVIIGKIFSPVSP